MDENWFEGDGAEGDYTLYVVDSMANGIEPDSYADWQDLYYVSEMELHTESLWSGEGGYF